jgi:calcium-binding protein CML
MERRHPRRRGAPRAAAAALALGVAAATWRHSWRSWAFGVSSPTAQTAASNTRGAQEPLVRLGAVKERQESLNFGEQSLKEKEESLNLKAEDIGAMYATGDSDMDELADSTWKEHFNVAFKSVDVNNDGKICFEDFSRVLSDTGPPFTNLNEEGIKVLFSLADSDSSGHLDFDEFITWQKSTRSLLDSFLKLDLDHDGLISKDEWRVALGKAGLDWTPEECNESFDGADTNGDGFLDFAEYTVWAAKA